MHYATSSFSITVAVDLHGLSVAVVFRACSLLGMEERDDIAKLESNEGYGIICCAGRKSW